MYRYKDIDIYIYVYLYIHIYGSGDVQRFIGCQIFAGVVAGGVGGVLGRSIYSVNLYQMLFYDDSYDPSVW